MKKKLIVFIMLIIIANIALAGIESEYLFDGQFKEINELRGKKYLEIKKDLKKEEYIELTRQPEKLTNWELVTRDKLIMEYDISHIMSYNTSAASDEATYHIRYFDIRKDFGEKFEYHNFGLSEQGYYVSRENYGILFDKERNRIVFFKDIEDENRMSKSIYDKYIVCARNKCLKINRIA